MIERPSSATIELIATDLDGTLLDSRSQVPERNRRAVQAAVARGVRLALVTARKRSSAFAIADLIDVPCACIAHNGARAWDWHGRELRHLTLDLLLAQRIAAFADEHAIPAIATIDEINYYSHTYPITSGWESKADQIMPALRPIMQQPPTRLIVASERGIDLVTQAWSDAPDALVLHRYFTRDGALESAVLTHPRATKADALDQLTTHIGIAPGAVLALGDAEADAGMLRWAGIGVAVGNAMPEAREAADWIAPEHDDAGVAAAIERFVLAPTRSG